MLIFQTNVLLFEIRLSPEQVFYQSQLVCNSGEKMINPFWLIQLINAYVVTGFVALHI